MLKWQMRPSVVSRNNISYHRQGDDARVNIPVLHASLAIIWIFCQKGLKIYIWRVSYFILFFSVFFRWLYISFFPPSPLSFWFWVKQVYIGGGGELATAREVMRHTGVEKCVMVDLDKVTTTSMPIHPCCTFFFFSHGCSSPFTTNHRQGSSRGLAIIFFFEMVMLVSHARLSLAVKRLVGNVALVVLSYPTAHDRGDFLVAERKNVRISGKM